MNLVTRIGLLVKEIHKNREIRECKVKLVLHFVSNARVFIFIVDWCLSIWTINCNNCIYKAGMLFLLSYAYKDWCFLYVCTNVTLFIIYFSSMPYNRIEIKPWCIATWWVSCDMTYPHNTGAITKFYKSYTAVITMLYSLQLLRKKLLWILWFLKHPWKFYTCKLPN